MDEKLQVFDIANELIIIPKAVIDTFLKEHNPSEIISLYTFYYYTAKWQGTNQPKCSTNYVSKGLHWKADKVRKVKKQLIEIGLVKDVRDIDKITHKVKGWYIKVNYIFKKSTVDNVIENHTPPIPEGGNSHSVENGTTNALSSSNLNALSSNNNTSTDIKKLYHSLLTKSGLTYIPTRVDYIVFANGYTEYIKGGLTHTIIEKCMQVWFDKKEGKWCGYKLSNFWKDISKLQAKYTECKPLKLVKSTIIVDGKSKDIYEPKI